MEMLNGDFDEKLEQFNSIIFLTHKPVGRAGKSDSIRSGNKLKSLIKLIENPFTSLKVGFDACLVPFLIKTSDINLDMVDSCECGFFSVYINEDLDVTPCSFCNSTSYHYNLKEFSFEEIWNHKFSSYRDFVAENSLKSCNHCKKNSECRGKCPFFDELFLCELIG